MRNFVFTLLCTQLRYRHYEPNELLLGFRIVTKRNKINIKTG